MKTNDGTVVVTGGSGLIGRYLCKRLAAEGLQVLNFDLRNDPAQDIRRRGALQKALQGATGVIHLAAVSRVAWAEKEPNLCRQTNVEALDLLVDLCLEAKPKPWLIFASSREVYGNPARLPVHEDDAMAPINAYGFSKRDGETVINRAREAGLLANICRFSNVYGCPLDHKDRVVMAFARAAARGGSMHIHGGGNTFDFTQVLDVVDGVWRLMQQTSAGFLLPPIHFASGEGVTLRELATMAAAQSSLPVDVVEAEPLPFNVNGFVGDTSRASSILGWQKTISLEEGLKMLISNMAKEGSA